MSKRLMFSVIWSDQQRSLIADLDAVAAGNE
jgi:hypothetical protein